MGALAYPLVLMGMGTVILTVLLSTSFPSSTSCLRNYVKRENFRR